MEKREYPQGFSLPHIQQLVDKWDKYGMLKEADGSKPTGRKAEVVAHVLENQYTQLTRKYKKDLLKESTLTNPFASGEWSGDQWIGSSMPLVSRVIGGLIANELVSIQPISVPTWLIFYKDVQFGSNNPSASGLDASINESPATGDSIFGTLLNESVQGEGGYYDFPNLFYTKNFVTVTGSIWTSSSEVATGSAIDAKELWFDYTTESINTNIIRIKIPWTTFSDLDTTAMKATALGNLTCQASGSNTVTATKVLRKYTTIVTGSGGANEHLYMYLEASASAGSITGSALEAVSCSEHYVRETDFNFRGDFEAGQTGVGTIPEINIKITSMPVTAQTRKLQAKWSFEEMEDVKAYHNFNMEEYIVNTLSDVVSLELDRTIIYDMLNNAGVTMYWAKKIGHYVNKYTGADLTTPTAFYGTQEEWFHQLLERIDDISSEIHKKSGKGGANFIVTSNKMVSTFGAIGAPRWVRNDKAMVNSEGIMIAGTLDGRKVYIVPDFPEPLMLVGRSGVATKDIFDTGYVYGPYVPLQLTPVILDPDTFEPRKLLYTRDVLKCVRPEYYGKIIVRDLNTY